MEASVVMVVVEPVTFMRLRSGLTAQNKAAFSGLRPALLLLPGLLQALQACPCPALAPPHILPGHSAVLQAWSQHADLAPGFLTDPACRAVLIDWSARASWARAASLDTPRGHVLSQSLGLSTEKDGGPLGWPEGVGPQAACLPAAVLGLKLDLELESFGLGAGGQAGEMMGPQVSDSGLSRGWGEANGSPNAQRLADARQLQSAEGPLCGLQGPLQAPVPPAHHQGD
ncbi:unnamed protein product [Rangifer tarandus platyrhynchus]|uniref:Uncharacterized protein n=2 Tax=Rangifer tarandus platyrhynchus TaxID=3082113 RepID=A0ABN8ZKD1_RANTA|nr:unnamed protein product [Rangifer tarandus platyrhynchus]CAI9708687.1 unnamed protein product [Rangifer tarandus platyrhynchus]